MKKEFTKNDEFNTGVEKNMQAAFDKTKGNRAEEIAPSTIEALSRGDQSAFRIVYLHSYDKLKEFLTILLHNPEDAEEVVQDIFLHILEHPEKINPRMNFKGYLFTVAKTKALNLMARRKLDKKYYNHRLTQPDEYNQAPDETVMSNELSLLITAYIDSMPPQRKRVFEMNRLEGKSISEIAKELDIKPQTVKNYLQTADEKLEKLLTLFIILFISL